VLMGHKEFAAIVKKDQQEFRRVLKDLRVIK
jgi:hypothetical protein